MKDYRVDAPIGDSARPENRGLNRTVPTQKPSHVEKPKPIRDPLIAGGWEKSLYGLVFALAMGSILLSGFINKRLENALVFALILSAIAIFLFFAV